MSSRCSTGASPCFTQAKNSSPSTAPQTARGLAAPGAARRQSGWSSDNVAADGTATPCGGTDGCDGFARGVQRFQKNPATDAMGQLGMTLAHGMTPGLEGSACDEADAAQ